jgi:hypothetical protein
MKFKELVQTNSWLSVATILLQLYPDEEKNISGYQKVFEELLYIHPEDSEILIVVAHQKDDFDGEEYVDVSGKYANPKNEEEEFFQAIEFTPWNKWLGMEISPESLLHFSELEIISHCLYEMTFAGFEEKKIQEKLKRMEKSIEDYKNMTDEEKKANTTSLEELMKDLEKDETE